MQAIYKWDLPAVFEPAPVTDFTAQGYACELPRPTETFASASFRRRTSAPFQLPTTARPWSFHGDGDAFKLAVEARRIDLAFTIDLTNGRPLVECEPRSRIRSPPFTSPCIRREEDARPSNTSAAVVDGGNARVAFLCWNLRAYLSSLLFSAPFQHEIARLPGSRPVCRKSSSAAISAQ